MKGFYRQRRVGEDVISKRWERIVSGQVVILGEKEWHGSYYANYLSADQEI